MPYLNRLGAAAVIVAAAAVPTSADALQPPRPRDASAAEALRVKAATSYVDVRGQDRSAASVLPSLPQATRSAQRAFGQAAGADAAVALDRSTGTVRSLQRFDGRLSGRLSGPPAAAARGWARDNAALLGLTAADVDGLDAARSTTTASGITVVDLGQSAAGIPAYDNGLRVVLDDAKRVVTVSGSPVRDLDPSAATPSVSATAALRSVARGVRGTRTPALTDAGTGARRTTRFAGGDVARLVWFRTAGRSRLAWSLQYDSGSDLFHAVVDARSGALLRRVDLTKYVINQPLFDHYPGAPTGGTATTKDIDPYLDDGATTLDGPFARTFLDVNDDDQPNPAVPAGAGQRARPTEEVDPTATASFTPFAANAEGFGAPCTPKLCSWDPLRAFSWRTNAAHSAIQAHYYVSRYHDHLSADPIAFDEGFAGDDPVDVNADDGADTSSNPGGGLPDDSHVNNANMSTPPDGQSPTMQMYLFNGGQPATEDPFRAMNGDDDAAIVFHEYTHGLSNRLVTTEDGFGALGSPQAGAMGEAWSDFYAKDFIVASGLETDSATPGDVDMGEYTDVVAHQIRSQGLDCRVTDPAAQCPAPAGGTAGPGGYTYGDFGKVDRRGPEVHADGEIWAQTLWDLRRQLGSARAEQLVTDAMRLSVPEPSYLDERNAILAADRAANGGANQTAIWTVFAGRGMGYFAAAVDGSDVAPVEDRSQPPSPAAGTGTISGTVTDGDSGAPAAGVRVGVAGHTTPGDDLSALTGPDGRYAITGVPAGTYPKLAFLVGSGYDPAVSTGVAVTNGATATADQALRYDWASRFAGPPAVTNDDTGASFGCGVEAARDQALGVGWSPNTDTAPESAGNPHPGTPPSVTIELPQAVDVSAFGMDPSFACGDDPSATTKDYRVETSPDGTTFTTAKQAAFAPEDAGRLNTVAPYAGAAGVKVVRLTLLSSQGSASADSGALFRDFSEFEVYGKPAASAPGGAGGGQQPGGGTPAPAPAPQATPVQPRLKLSKASRAGKVRFRLTCPTACRVVSTLKVSKAQARRIGRKGRRTLVTSRRTAAASPTTRELAVSISRKLRRSLKARRVKRVTVTLAVRVTSTVGGRSAVRRSTVTLRLRV